MGEAGLKEALFEQLARVGKGLANGKRLELLDLLAQSERTVEALATAAGLNLTTASAHLQLLKQAGLVSTRRDGTRIFYRLSGSDVLALLVQARGIAARRLPDVRAARDAYLGDSHQISVLDLEELARRMSAEEVTLVDVRPRLEYAAGHLPGAVNIPVEDLESRLEEIPTDREVVAYCRGPYCTFAHDAVRVLQRHGRRASRLTDGVTEWRLAGLPIATAEP